MRDVLFLESQARTMDGQGGYVISIATEKQIFARVEPKTESRVLDAAQLEYETAYKIYCRYDPQITNNSYLGYKGLRLTIHSCVNISGLNRYLEILAYSSE